MGLKRLHTLAFPLLLALAAVSGVRAQSSAATLDWETLRPSGEEFSILMPKGSTAEASKEPYHKMELSWRLYLSRTQGGPVFAVASLSGIKSNPAAYTELERVNSYVDAFRIIFPQKLRGKDAVAKLTLAGYKKLNGYEAREYRLSVAELSGTVRALATRKRFYAFVVLNTKKDTSLEEQFLSSFAIPDRPTDTAATNATTEAQNPSKTTEGEAAPASSTAPTKPSTGQPQKTEGTGDQPSDQKPAEPTTDKPQSSDHKGPISGGVLNGKALSLPQPDYPAEARGARASGSVVVQVLIDEQGNVVAAKAVSGHPLLQAAAVNAALLAKFSPTTLMGDPVKVSGVIVYNFVL